MANQSMIAKVEIDGKGFSEKSKKHLIGNKNGSFSEKKVHETKFSEKEPYLASVR